MRSAAQAKSPSVITSPSARAATTAWSIAGECMRFRVRRGRQPYFLDPRLHCLTASTSDHFEVGAKEVISGKRSAQQESCGPCGHRVRAIGARGTEEGAGSRGGRGRRDFASTGEGERLVGQALG